MQINKDKGLMFIGGCIVSLFLILVISLNIQPKVIYVESEEVVENEPKEWNPGDINEEGTHQVMPTFEVTEDSHNNFKNMIAKYQEKGSKITAQEIWEVENYYGLKEGVIWCITVAETSGGTKGRGKCNNFGNVAMFDRGGDRCYATVGGGLEAIGYTLNNDSLGKKSTLGCLSNAGNCIEEGDNGKRWATSESSWEKNMIACLYSIYQKPIDAKTFSIRR